MKEKCSPKEVIVAAEECLERIHRTATEDSTHDGDVEEEAEEEGKTDDENGQLLMSEQIARLVHIFSGAISYPRLFPLNSLLKVIDKMTFRRRSPLETIKSFIPELQSIIKLIAERLSRSSGELC